MSMGLASQGSARMQRSVQYLAEALFNLHSPQRHTHTRENSCHLDQFSFEVFLSFIPQISAESLSVSGSVSRAGYTKMSAAATQGLTEPRRGSMRLQGPCLTSSKNKLEVPERTTVLLCSSSGLFN